MIHITLTGIYAGTPVCCVDRNEATLNGDSFAHIGGWIDNKDSHKNICPTCLDTFYPSEIDIINNEVEI